jgi:hypothetical protein
MRRLVLQVAVLALLAAFGLAVPSGASAAPAQAAAAACSDAAAYPPGANATLQVDTTNPVIGETIKVSGIKFCPNEDVDITIEGVFVATAHTDARGAFDPEVKVTGAAGEKQVCGVGASGLASDRDCLTINARAATSIQNPAPGKDTDTGNPAMTGVEIALLGVLALVLVVGGVLFTTIGRRRNSAARI